MSSVLTMQIAQALFPWMRQQGCDEKPESRSRSNSDSHHDCIIPSIRIEPAEMKELRPLLSELKRSPARHRRSPSASSYSTVSSARQSLDEPAALPHVGLAMLGR